jgi:Response regulator containing a CheY-like receiver domain and a GGDEF domain
VRDLKIPHQGNPHGIVTISIGICAKVPHMYNDTPISFINEADSALYQAKKRVKTAFTALKQSSGHQNLAARFINPAKMK